MMGGKNPKKQKRRESEHLGQYFNKDEQTWVVRTEW